MPLRGPVVWETFAATASICNPGGIMPELLKSVEDGVMKLTFNRPDAMNALSRDMMTAFLDSLNEAASSRDIGCVVVRGAGEKAFCAGGDVKSMAAGRDQDK